MNKQENDEKQAFFEHINQYEFIEENGRLTLEPFCVFLCACLNIDRPKAKKHNPSAIHQLLLKMIRERLGADAYKQYVASQNIFGWRPDQAYMFPNKSKTLIHVAALVQLSHDWIADIGYVILKIKRPLDVAKYFAWVDHDWTFTHAFINRYHNELALLQKRIDRNAFAENGYSMFEALNLCGVKGIPFDEAVEVLVTRHKNYQAAIKQIQDAIDNKYYLESIALQECLISHCIFNFLENLRAKPRQDNFHSLIKEMLSLEELEENFNVPNDLFKKIDLWRVDRNASIHGYFTTNNFEFGLSRQEFSLKSSITATEGLALVKEILAWYEFECVNFIRHEWPAAAIDKQKHH